MLTGRDVLTTVNSVKRRFNARDLSIDANKQTKKQATKETWKYIKAMHNKINKLK